MMNYSARKFPDITVRWPGAAERAGRRCRPAKITVIAYPISVAGGRSFEADWLGAPCSLNSFRARLTL